MTSLVGDFEALQRQRAGPLSTHIEAFTALLVEQGYATSTVRDKVRLVADLGQWLARKDLRADDLDAARVGAFVRHQRRRAVRGHPQTLRQLLTHLRAAGVVRPATPVHDDSAVGRIAETFEQHLIHERGLSVSTRLNYLPIVRRFLTARFGKRDVRLSALHPSDAGRFLLRHAHTVSPGRARLMVTGLRAFLRWAHLQGEVGTDLLAEACGYCGGENYRVALARAARSGAGADEAAAAQSLWDAMNAHEDRMAMVEGMPVVAAAALLLVLAIVGIGRAYNYVSGEPPDCDRGEVICGRQCVDTMSDRANCNGCGISCGTGRCLNGTCL